MNDRAIALGLVGVLAIGLVVLFFAGYKKEDYEFFVEPDGAASSNPFLAAQRLLDSLGYKISGRNRFAPSIELPGPRDTAFLAFSYMALQQQELDLLLEWVSAGGHLVVQLTPGFGMDYDPIFTAIGVEALAREREEESQEGESDAGGSPWDQRANPNREHWGNVSRDNGVSIDFGANEPLWTVRDQFGNFAGQVAYDQGRITAIADMAIFTNRWIAREDHAYLLTRMLGPAALAGHIWLVQGGGFPSLWSLVVERAGFLLVAGALVLLLVLWWAAQRFGPPIAPPTGVRKAFIEHIEASGRFLWRHQRHAQLLKSTQSAFLHDAQRRHPRLRGHALDERSQYLARVCNVSVDDAADALAQTASRSHADFLRRIQILKTMWTKL